MAGRRLYRPFRALFLSPIVGITLALVGPGLVPAAQAHFPNYCGHNYTSDAYNWDGYNRHMNAKGVPQPGGNYHQVYSYFRTPSGWIYVHWHLRRCH